MLPLQRLIPQANTICLQRRKFNGRFIVFRFNLVTPEQLTGLQAETDSQIPLVDLNTSQGPEHTTPLMLSLTATPIFFLTTETTAMSSS